MGWADFFAPGDSSQQAEQHNTASPTPSKTSSIALTEEQRMRVFGRHSSPAPDSQPSRDQKADKELEALIKSFEESDKKSSQTTQTADSPDPTPTPSLPNRHLPDGSIDISSEAIYPRTMSCRQQFDQAFYCQSLGGKFNDIYRYGYIKSCSEQWGAFWFCMRTRTLPKAEKEEAIREYYRDRDQKRKAEWGSSEDVWQIREKAVTRAFWKDPDEDEGENVVLVNVREGRDSPDKGTTVEDSDADASGTPFWIR